MTQRIIVVDNDPHVLFVLRHTVAGLGNDYEIVASTEAATALEELQKHHADLIITDIFMEGMDGIELTERVREVTDDVPVIWITAHGCHRLVTKVEDLRVFRCLDKPLRISEIRRVAREALGVQA